MASQAKEDLVGDLLLACSNPNLQNPLSAIECATWTFRMLPDGTPGLANNGVFIIFYFFLVGNMLLKCDEISSYFFHFPLPYPGQIFIMMIIYFIYSYIYELKIKMCRIYYMKKKSNSMLN